MCVYYYIENIKRVANSNIIKVVSEHYIKFIQRIYYIFEKGKCTKQC